MNPKSGFRTGLTVIELVSALALLILVLGALLVALDTATDVWSASTSKGRTQLHARSAVDQFATDMTAAFAELQFRDDGTQPPAANSPSSAEFPLFIVENRNNQQVGVYFIRSLSPAEMHEGGSLSLELIGYSWISQSNMLYRVTQPIRTSDRGRVEPRLSEQLSEFVGRVQSSTHENLTLALASVVDFAPLVYQPMNPAIVIKEAEPIKALNSKGEPIRLADLPDYVDVLIAYFDSQNSSSGNSHTNYLTRRIILPSAHASRLP